MCDESHIPRVFVVNKMDRENADFAKNVAEIQAAFGRQCIPFQVTLSVFRVYQGTIKSNS
jgi:elongation factor G